MANPLRREVILQGMADAIPEHPKGDSSSDLSSSYEVLALLIHAYMTALKFRLLGFDEDKKIEEECRTLAPRLPPSWNASFGSHSFVYAHKQSAMTFVVKVDRLGNKVEVRGLAVGDDRIYRFEKNIRDVVRSAGLPLRITLNNEGEEDRSDLVEKIKALFASEQAIDNIISDLKVNIIQKFIPKLQIEGYEEEIAVAAAAPGRGPAEQPRRPGPLHDPFSEPRPQPANPYPINDPLAAPPNPRRPIPGDFAPPDFEDEHQINTPLRPLAQGPVGMNPYNIGHDDLNPPGLGPHDPLRPSFIGQGGLPRPGGGFGGMHPTFDDPLFQGPGGSGGGGEGEGFNPQAPPGARWDPVGPGGGPRARQGGGRHPFGGFGGDGGVGGGFGGDII